MAADWLSDGVVRREVPGVGRSLFATRGLAAGETVMVSHGLAIDPLQSSGLVGLDVADLLESLCKLPADERAWLLKESKQLHPVDQGAEHIQEFMRQQPVSEEDYMGMLGAVLDDFPACGLADAEEYRRLLVRCNFNLHQLGLLPLIAQLNHSCSENLVPAPKSPLCSGLVVVEVKAKRDIAEGEQLCINYLSGRQQKQCAQRRKQVLSRWGFECGCALCCLNEATETASKRARKDTESRAQIRQCIDNA
eukprot:TRINITY_DN24241_c0_g1_i1.p1 TRINITY_DN24241_c0_g1~~TRINITY_DN24241_c0_g1_i1.p1  ORF type:complete len:250 (+),score=33.15 TRINITY_DN24241_c0_g1_i1:231-980(+)